MDPPTPPGLGSAVAEASTAAIPAAAAGPSRLLATAHKHNHPSYYDVGVLFPCSSVVQFLFGCNLLVLSGPFGFFEEMLFSDDICSCIGVEVGHWAEHEDDIGLYTTELPRPAPKPLGLVDPPPR